jgi:DNA-binding IclR family transcriptional regulator
LAWDPDLMDAVLRDPLVPITESTITSSEDLEAAVKKTRVDGFAITVGEREDGASGLSAPVFDSAAGLVGAVTVSGPTLRMPLETCESWVEPLLATAEHMTRLIGGRFPGES